MRRIIREAFDWTGFGCDLCGYGSVEDVDKFSPYLPCPECGEVMVEAQGEEDLAPHLREPVEDEEECWGPVPPIAPDPYVQQDPYTRDTSVLGKRR